MFFNRCKVTLNAAWVMNACDEFLCIASYQCSLGGGLLESSNKLSLIRNVIA